MVKTGQNWSKWLKTVKISENQWFLTVLAFPLGLVRGLETTVFSGFGGFEQIGILGRPPYPNEAW